MFYRSLLSTPDKMAKLKHFVHLKTFDWKRKQKEKSLNSNKDKKHTD